MSFLEELRVRGLLHQTTADEALQAHLQTPGRVGYCGFDPTRRGLTIGNFMPIKLLMHWQRCGHKPVVLMGGGTGLIGDPTGKDSERQLLDRDTIDDNVAAQRKIIERFLDLDPKSPTGAVIVNNADWLERLGYIEVLRDIGKHFSVNAMIQKDSVRERLKNREQGISYTEFSYMLLQAYDFLHLRREINCTVQISGSDQYGNIVAGIDLIRRELGSGEAYGITAPLLLGADGKKIGKTEKGAIWLNAELTSPYAFYQHWINASDADAVPFLRWFTFLTAEEVEGVAERHAQAPHKREAQRRLAREMTQLVHGPEALRRVEAAGEALFGGDVRALDAEMLRDVFKDVPPSQHARQQLEGQGLPLLELLPQTTLASSKREARQFLASGAVSVNGQKAPQDYRLTSGDLLHGSRILLRRGKKHWHATDWDA